MTNNFILHFLNHLQTKKDLSIHLLHFLPFGEIEELLNSLVLLLALPVLNHDFYINLG